MNTIFYNANGKAVAVNYKVATSTLARAIIRDFNLELDSLLTTPHGDGTGTAYPEGKDSYTTLLHRYVSKIKNPTEALLLVRDPVEKFRSACSMSQIGDGGRMTVDEMLTNLESEGFNEDVHFFPQSRFLTSGVKTLKLYKLTDIDALAIEAGLTLPLPTVNKQGTVVEFPKPDLTPEQTARVEAFYSEDIALFDSITEAGQAYNAPATDEDKESAKRTVESNLQAKLVEPIFVNGVQVNTDDKTQAELTGLQTAIGRRPNLEVDYKVKLQSGGTAWTKLTAVEIGAMFDAVADNKIALYAAAKALDEAIDSTTTLDDLKALDLSIT